MGKHGPCRHCGVTSTPLWRNGPPEKPVLCNACGSRWRTKGSLVNYTPLHARELFEWEEPKITKSKSLPFKNTEQKLQKRKRMVENVCEMPFSESGQNYIRTFEGDFSNRSSSGSAISYSESCANFGVVDASDWTGSAQSNACVPLLPVPSKKRTVINLKPSPVEKLTKDLYSIWHEQQSSNLSGSLEEELLFEAEMPMGSAEIGHGGVLLRYPSSKATEEESEASSLPTDNKLVGGPFSRSSILIDSESRRTSLSNSSVDKFKNFTGNVTQDHARRDRFSAESLDMLQNRESLLRFTDLKDIINLEVFTKHMKNEEQQQLLKYLPSIDTANPPESLGSMFSSPQFLENLSYYQQHLQNGIFDLSYSQMNAEENRNLKRLLLLNFTKSRWVEHYNEMKDTTYKQSTGVNKGDRTNFLRHSNLKPIKRSHEFQYQQLEESKGTMRSPKRVCRSNSTKHSLTKSSLLLPPNQSESIEFADTESFLDNGGTCFSPRSLFAPLPDRSSMLQFADDSSDQGVLLDVRCGAPFPEAELLYHHPWDQKASSNNSHAESCAVAEEESLCSFRDSSFAGEKLNQTA